MIIIIIIMVSALRTLSKHYVRTIIIIIIMWGVRTKVIPVVVGALGSIPLRLNDNLRAIEVGIPVGLIQRCALLGSARILRKVLEM